MISGSVTTSLCEKTYPFSVRDIFSGLSEVERGFEVDLLRHLASVGRAVAIVIGVYLPRSFKSVDGAYR